MKTLKLKYYVTLILLMISSSVYSQTDTGNTYYTDDLSIILNGISDSNIVINKSSGKTDLTLSKRINNINRISFLNDSIVSVSNKEQSNLQLNINKINSVKIKNGSKVGTGLALGGLGGLLTGFIIGTAIEPKSSSGFMSGFMSGVYPLAGGLGGLLIGMGLGAVIGGSVNDYMKIDLNKYKNDKRIMFESIFKADKRKNNSDNWWFSICMLFYI